jgi:hypothetical protein
VMIRRGRLLLFAFSLALCSLDYQYDVSVEK